MSFHTAPGQRAGGCAGSPPWQWIHPGAAGWVSEGGGWCCQCPGPQISLSSPSWFPGKVFSFSKTKNWIWKNYEAFWAPGLCLIKTLILIALVYLNYFTVSYSDGHMGGQSTEDINEGLSWDFAEMYQYIGPHDKSGCKQLMLLENRLCSLSITFRAIQVAAWFGS